MNFTDFCKEMIPLTRGQLSMLELINERNSRSLCCISCQWAGRIDQLVPRFFQLKTFPCPHTSSEGHCPMCGQGLLKWSVRFTHRTFESWRSEAIQTMRRELRSSGMNRMYFGEFDFFDSSQMKHIAEIVDDIDWK